MSCKGLGVVEIPSSCQGEADSYQLINIFQQSLQKD